MGREKNKEGGGKIVILSTSTSTSLPTHKTSKKKRNKKKTHKQATQETYVKLLDKESWEKLQNVC